MAQKLTDITPFSTQSGTLLLHIVDTGDTSQDPAGSSYKIDETQLAGVIEGPLVSSLASSGSQGQVWALDSGASPIWTWALYDSSYELAMDFSERSLRDATGAYSVTWDARFMYDVDHALILNWNLCEGYDGDELKSFNWKLRQEYDSSELLAHSYGTRHLYYGDGTSTSINYGIGYTYDSAGIVTMSYRQRYLLDDALNIVFDWNSYLFYSNAGIANFDFSGTTPQYWDGAAWVTLGSGGGLPSGSDYQALTLDGSNAAVFGSIFYDASGADVFDYFNRVFFGTGGGSDVSLTTGSRNLVSSSQNSAVNWENRTAYDDNNFVSHDWENRAFHNTTGANFRYYNTVPEYSTDNGTTWITLGTGGLPSGANYETLQLDGSNAPFFGSVFFDATGVSSIEYFGRFLYYPDGSTISVDWGQALMFDVSSVLSYNWDLRLLYRSDGTPTIDYENSSLLVAAGSSINWEARLLYNSTGSDISIDYGNSLLKNSSSADNFRWNNTIPEYYNGAWIALGTPVNIGKTIFTPTTGGSITLTVNNYNIVNPAGPLLALTVNLPATPADGNIVEIKFTKAITTVTYSGGTISDAITSPVLGTFIKLMYDSGTSTWY